MPESGKQSGRTYAAVVYGTLTIQGLQKPTGIAVMTEIPVLMYDSVQIT